MKYHLALMLIAALAAPILAADAGRAQNDPNQPQEERSVAQAGVDAAGPPIQDYSMIVSDTLPPTLAARSLIIPKDTAEPKDLANLDEDLKIMAHILQKAAGGDAEKSPNAMGIFIRRQVFDRASVPQNLYLEGYGALFFLSVNYPLVEPPARKAESETKEESNSDWEAARRELAQPSGPPGFNFLHEQLLIEDRGAAQESAYDADKVETLKGDLIAALKNASHIRRLKADETVTVVVAGLSGKGGAKIRGARTTRHAGGGVGGGMAGGGVGGGMPGGGMGGGMGGGGMGSMSGDSMSIRGGIVTWTRRAVADSRGSRLILRARKSDVDSFQKDKLSLDDFRKKVTVIAE
ncbi:MAG: hypothetical protein ACLQM8_01945 [Limisphaerales bacterium]